MGASTNPFTPLPDGLGVATCPAEGQPGTGRPIRHGNWLVAVLAVLFATASLTAVYFYRVIEDSRGEAVATIQISRTLPTVLPGPRFSDRDPMEFDRYKNTQSNLIVSYTILRGALARPEIAQLPIIKSQADPIEWLQDHLEVKLPTNSEYMIVSLTGGDRKQCVRVLNAVVKEYVDRANSQERTKKNTQIDKMRAYVEHSKVNLSERERQYRELSKVTDADSVDLMSMQRELDQQRKLHVEFMDDLARMEIELNAPDRVALVQEAQDGTEWGSEDP